MEEKLLQNIISEVVKRVGIKLNESSRDNLLAPYLEVLNSKGKNISLSQLKQYLLAKFVNEASINNLSLESNYYLAGIARYYFNGDLTTNKKLNVFYPKFKDKFIPEVCIRLNALIMVLRNAYIDSIGTKFEQPEDFGTLPLKNLLRKYNKAINKELGIENGQDVVQKKETNTDEHVGNGYTFDILYSYEDARKYNQYTSPGAWCITYGAHHYNNYVHSLKIHYVIFKKDGFENIPRQKGANWSSIKPQDEYGNSLIALLQSNINGEPVYITSRWNHGTYDDGTSCEADHAYTKDEFMRIVGITDKDLQRIFRIWKDNKPPVETSEDNVEQNKEKQMVLRIFKYAQMRINGGNIANAFGDYENEILASLTNVAKINAIKEKMQAEYDLGNEVESQRLEKTLNKAINGTVRLGMLKVNGECWTYLIDGNKILFETIAKKETWGDMLAGPVASSPENRKYGNYEIDAANYENVVIYKGVNGYMIYDTRKHQFLEIEGIKKFKFITSISQWEREKDYEGVPGYYEVKMSRDQAALINVKTNEPVVLPNGHSWFEYVRNVGYRWGRRVRTNYMSSLENVLEIVYDSSASEFYFYDMHNRKFFNPDEMFGCQDLHVSAKLPYGISVLYGKTPARYTEAKCLIKNGEPYLLNGMKFFDFVEAIDDTPLFVYKSLDPVKDYKIYDIESGESYDVLTYDNKELGFNDGGKSLILFTLKHELGGSIIAVFSSQFRTWLKNPVNYPDEYLFKLYGVNVYSGTLTVNKEGRRYNLKLSENKPEFILENNMSEDKKTKKIVLTTEQLNRILREENTTTVQLNTTGNTIPSVTNTLLQNQDKIRSASKYGDVDLHFSNPNAANGSNDTVPTQHVEVNDGQNISQAINQQVNPTVLADGGDIEVSGDGVSEWKKFSKRMVEEARLDKIRQNGIVITKRALSESFLSEDVNNSNRYIETNTVSNKLKEYTKKNIVYISHLGFEIRIDSDLGSIYTSREHGGSSVSKMSKGDFLKMMSGDKTIVSDIIELHIRNLDSNNMPQKLLVSDISLAKKIAYWIRVSNKNGGMFGKWDFPFDKNLMNYNAWLEKTNVSDIPKYEISNASLNELEENPHNDRNQWNDEYRMFMDGLEKGQYEIFNDTLYVQIFNKSTQDNDPRFVYIKKGEDKLHDDHFYIQNSPVLSDNQLKDIYYAVGWEDVLPELIDYDNFEMYENKIGIIPEPKTFIISWMAELTAPKKGKVGGKMLIKAVDEKEAEKRFKKRLFANGYNGKPVSFTLVDLKIEEADNVKEGKIKINPENKGKFNATKKRTGKPTEELTHSSNPITKKRAIFSQNAAKWRKK